jgi:hypothetical protein
MRSSGTRSHYSRRSAFIAAGLVAAAILGGCAMPFSPDEARDPYPRMQARGDTMDVQVFREGTSVVIVNTTTRSFTEFDLWLNQRFVRRLPHLSAGETLRIGLFGFIDENGESFEPGGFFSTEQPTTIWLAEIQEKPDTPMIGLVTIGTTGSRQR